MNTVYDSESFAVVHILANAVDAADVDEDAPPQLPRHGFELSLIHI